MLYALYPHKKTDILSIDWTSENYDLLDQEGWLDTQSVQLKFNLKAGKTPAALSRYDIIFHLGYLIVSKKSKPFCSPKPSGAGCSF